jgi:prolyl oligopeptidase
VRIESWVKSSLWCAYDPRSGKLDDTKLMPSSPVDFSQIESVEVKARSADGTLVPLSIIYKRGLARDGSNPTLLNGYGAYGTSLDPSFDPTRLAWLERGGVLALAHVRGGGEYGEEWHQAGMKLTKYNTIDDFIACAEYLIQEKYTSAKFLGGEGRSAGSITISGAITKRPDLFAAGLIIGGSPNVLRSEEQASGPANALEFGTVKTPDGFKAVEAMDAYHRVKPGVAYPAIMLAAGIADLRVAPWQSAKMTARLQADTRSGKPVLLRVSYDEGHGFGSTKAQRDELTADKYAFLLWQFGIAAYQPQPASGQSRRE